jgi:hypothetical protein
MKKYFQFVAIGTIMMISCQSKNNTNSNSQRFSTKLDTSYKENSTEIDNIRRTLFQFGTYSSDEMIYLCTKVPEAKEFVMGFKNKDNLNIALFENADLFEKFLKDVRTVLSNPNKNLTFTFGILNDGKITQGTDVGSVSLFLYQNSKSTLNYMKSSEIDSLESCYKRFLKEKK